ncbi:hypothetical protein BJ085DRAFT_39172 [Dimargaris cristalligena]|uniref:Helicase Sen1 N-terminal domain-containing protein n=1 Tax=Dimargaris cristalligena TaxID=215637 RepID=A0A4P9ZMV2_9FUNG|nr:hypothetical protein BJ085DRAFT_39172 [Dimargaris cristalligena]|eukprot:RKP34418.1 hypothetical protein BJ085DRAFT_39172 [Dimargaris cristalligena]
MGESPTQFDRGRLDDLNKKIEAILCSSTDIPEASAYAKALPGLTEQFCQLGIHYFLEGEPSKLPCWWCNRTLSPFLTKLLYLFQFGNSPIPEINKFQRIMGDQLGQCVDCINEYIKAKALFRSQCLGWYGQAGVDALFQRIFYWDLARVWRAAYQECERLGLLPATFPVTLVPPVNYQPKNGLPFGGMPNEPTLNVSLSVAEPPERTEYENDSSSPSQRIQLQTLCVICEVLANPAYLRHTSLHALFSLLLRHTLDLVSLQIGNKLLPGFLILMFHPWASIRGWTHTAIKNLDEPVADPDDWSFIRPLFKLITDQILADYTRLYPKLKTLAKTDFDKANPAFDPLVNGVKILNTLIPRITSGIINPFILSEYPTLPYYIASLIPLATRNLLLEALQLFAHLLSAFPEKFWDHALINENSGLPLKAFGLQDFNPAKSLGHLLNHNYLEMSMRDNNFQSESTLAADASEGFSNKFHRASRRLRPIIDWMIPFALSVVSRSKDAEIVWSRLFDKTSSWATQLYTYPEENCLVAGHVFAQLLVHYYRTAQHQFVNHKNSNPSSDPEVEAPTEPTNSPPSNLVLPWIVSHGTQVVDALAHISKFPLTRGTASDCLGLILRRDINFFHQFVDEAIELRRAIATFPPDHVTEELSKNSVAFQTLFPALYSPLDKTLAKTIWIAGLQGTLPTELQVELLVNCAEVLWCDHSSLLEQTVAAWQVVPNNGPLITPMAHMQALQQFLDGICPLLTDMLRRMTRETPVNPTAIIKVEPGLSASTTLPEFRSEIMPEVRAVLTNRGIMAMLQLMFLGSEKLRLTIYQWIRAHIKYDQKLNRVLSVIPLPWAGAQPVALLVAYSPEDSIVCLGEIIDTYRQGALRDFSLCRITADLHRILVTGLTTFKLLINMTSSGPPDALPLLSDKSRGFKDAVSMARVQASLPGLWLRMMDFVNVAIHQGFRWDSSNPREVVVKVMSGVFECCRVMLTMFPHGFYPLAVQLATTDLHTHIMEQLESELQQTTEWLNVTDTKLRDAALGLIFVTIDFPLQLGAYISSPAGQRALALVPKDLDQNSLLRSASDVIDIYRYELKLMTKLLHIARSERGQTSLLAEYQKSELEVKVNDFLQAMNYPLTSDLRPRKSLDGSLLPVTESEPADPVGALADLEQVDASHGNIDVSESDDSDDSVTELPTFIPAVMPTIETISISDDECSDTEQDQRASVSNEISKPVLAVSTPRTDTSNDRPGPHVFGDLAYVCISNSPPPARACLPPASRRPQPTLSISASKNDIARFMDLDANESGTAQSNNLFDDAFDDIDDDELMSFCEELDPPSIPSHSVTPAPASTTLKDFRAESLLTPLTPDSPPSTIHPSRFQKRTLIVETPPEEDSKFDLSPTRPSLLSRSRPVMRSLTQEAAPAFTLAPRPNPPQSLGNLDDVYHVYLTPSAKGKSAPKAFNPANPRLSLPGPPLP